MDKIYKNQKINIAELLKKNEISQEDIFAYFIMQHTERNKNKELITNLKMTDRYVTEDSNGRKTIITKSNVTILETSLDGKTIKTTRWAYGDNHVESSITTVSDIDNSITFKSFVDNEWKSTSIRVNGRLMKYMNSDGIYEWYDYDDNGVSYTKHISLPDGTIKCIKYINSNIVSVSVV